MVPRLGNLGVVSAHQGKVSLFTRVILCVHVCWGGRGRTESCFKHSHSRDMSRKDRHLIGTLTTVHSKGG